MSTFRIDIEGNMESKPLSMAKSVDTLTASLKAEEKALASANIAAVRTAAGLDPKQYARASNAVKEATARIGLLRAESARLTDVRNSAPAVARLGRSFRDAFGASTTGKAIAATVAGVKKLRAVTRGDIAEGLGKRLGAAAGEAPKALGAAIAATAKVAAVGLTIATVAAVALSAKLYDVGKAAITAGVGFVDEARSARLMNEAADLAGGSHKQLGGIIDDVNRRATIGKDRISQLGRELRTARFDSRQTQLTLDAMAVAESALGQGASGAVRGIADASRATRRFSLGIRDAYGEYESLKASGLTKGEVFGELAASMHKSVDAVKREVGAGRVSATRGMQAIDAAMRKKFGGNVAAQALGIDRQVSRLREDFVGLFSGAQAEPLLKGLNKITSIFSKDTAEGKAFGEIVSRVMNELGKTAEALAPQIKEFIVGLGADAAKPGGLAETIRGWISDAKDLGATLKDVATAIKDIAGAAKTIGGAVGSVTGAFTKKADTSEIDRLNKIGRIDSQLAQQGKVEGQALTAGVSAGIESGTASTVGSITAFSAALNRAFKAANLIKSPSKLYERDARQIPAGASAGVEAGTPRAVAAVQDMSAAMFGGFELPAPRAAGGSQKGGDTYHLHVENHGVQGAEEIGPELVRWIKYANDGGPRPAHV